jgi:hypothetical protein
MAGNIMKPMQYLFPSGLRLIILRAWRSLLRSSRAKPALAPKADRRVSCGRTGNRTAYVIHSSPLPSIQGEDLQKNIRMLVEASEKRFLDGYFFAPIAEKLDQQSAVITGITRQGSPEVPIDHVIAIFPYEK